MDSKNNFLNFKFQKKRKVIKFLEWDINYE